MKGELYFQNVPNVDSLFMEQILFSYENIPIVFVCTDKSNFRYLCVCDDIIEEEAWLIVKINNLKLLEILNDDSTVLSAFMGKKVIIAHRDSYHNTQYDIMNYNDINNDDLPICDQFLEMKDHLNSYIDKIRNDIILYNIELPFHIHDIFDNEISTFQFQSILKRKIETEVYCKLCEDTKADNIMEYFSNNFCSIQFNCKTTHEETSDFNNHSKETIAFAA